MRLLPLFFLGCIALFFWAACENEPTGEPEGNDTADSTRAAERGLDETVSPAEKSGLLGTWELTEIRVPTPIQVSGTFFTFSSEGTLTISNPDDPELEDRVMPFAFEDSSLTYDQPYTLRYVDSDSLVLESETDGIREINILRRR